MLRIPGVTCLAGLLALSLGCSSDSALNMYVTELSGVSGENAGKSYLECDVIGSSTDPCTVVQDMVNVKVTVEAPGELGPSLNAFLTGYTLEYFYFDPSDGQLRGPVPGLTLGGTLAKVPVISESASFEVAAVTFRVKAWSVGVDCSDLAGYSGLQDVHQMIVRITVHGEDGTGKAMSADGSILVYLFNYAPQPDPSDWCDGLTPETYLSGVCR